MPIMYVCTAYVEGQKSSRLSETLPPAPCRFYPFSGEGPLSKRTREAETVPGLLIRPRCVPSAVAGTFVFHDRRMDIDTVSQFQQFVRLESVNAEKNRRRFYILSWQPALFDGWALVLVWGRQGTPGRMQMQPFMDREQAEIVIARLLRRRLQHGYMVADWH
jgi:predicted DNA-binding WGR domain protein